MAIFSNLDLNRGTPKSVQPKVGQWRHQLIPTTFRKRLQRVLVMAVFLAAVGLLVYFGNFFYESFTHYYPR